MKDDTPDTPGELRARALKYLARREHSRAELARKLAPRAESPEALGQLLDALAAKRQLSDERYAEARARQLARKYGAARIRHELRAQGVDEDIVARSTAVDYLIQYIQAEKPADISAWVADDVYQEVCAAVQIVGRKSLRAIYEHLGGQVPYDEIKLVLAHRDATS